MCVTDSTNIFVCYLFYVFYYFNIRLDRQDALKRPDKIRVTNDDFWMTNAIKDEEHNKHGERVLSAHIIPQKFPVNPDNMIYPDVKNAENPLYYTNNTTYGNEQPREFHLLM